MLIKNLKKFFLGVGVLGGPRGEMEKTECDIMISCDITQIVNE